MKNRSAIGCQKKVNARLKEGRKEMFYLTTHSTHYIYGYMASDIWLRTNLIVRKEGRKEMFYLTTHSTHFIYGYMERERNVLFNDALNTFYLRLWCQTYG